MKAARLSPEKCLALSAALVHRTGSVRQHGHVRDSAEVLASGHQPRISCLGASNNDRVEHVETLADLQIGRLLCHRYVDIDDRGP